jgi:hypothetical protein
MIRPKRTPKPELLDQYILSLKHLPGGHDQRSHGRSTGRRQAYRSAYRKVRDSGGSIQEARTAALEASQQELQKKLESRRAERDARRAERAANRKVKPPVVQPEETPTVPLVDTGGPYRTMDPKEVVASVKAFAEQVNRDVDAKQAAVDAANEEYKALVDDANRIYDERRDAIIRLEDSGISRQYTYQGIQTLIMDGEKVDIPAGSTPDFRTDEQAAAWAAVQDAELLYEAAYTRSDVARQRIFDAQDAYNQAIKDANQAVYDHIAVNMRHPNPYVPTFAYNDPQGMISPDQRARIEREVTRVLGMVGADNVEYGDKPIQINYDGGGRASAGGSARFTTFNTNGDNSISTIWHESMHIIQSKTRGTAIDQIPHDFAIQRISASKEKKPKSMTAQSNRKTKEVPSAQFGKYETDEFGYYDTVDNPYTLKIYQSIDKTPFQEVLAMAFTDVRGQTTNFERYQDPELFEVGIRAIQSASIKVQFKYAPTYSYNYSSVTNAPDFEQIRNAYQYTEVQP